MIATKNPRAFPGQDCFRFAKPPKPRPRLGMRAWHCEWRAGWAIVSADSRGKALA